MAQTPSASGSAPSCTATTLEAEDEEVFTAAASFLCVFLCLTGPSRATGQELTVIMKSPPMHLNNAVTSSTQTIQIATQLFASPLRYDLDWNPEPYLASSWSFSEDKKSLTLHLVPDAVFHDGKPVTSEDVAFSIMAIKANHPFKTMFEPVEAVDTPDPHTAVIRLSKPHPAILLCLAPPLCPIIPKHVYGDGQDVRTHPANSAPCRLRAVPVRGNEGRGIRHPRKEPALLHQGPPHAHRAIFRFVKDPPAA
ncbi:MAG: ABC transporter substrate-binding protein [Bilophila wadsworthia]